MVEYGVWPNPMYPPSECHGCRRVFPEEESAWGFCADCFDEMELD